jgi:hypothetical protein
VVFVASTNLLVPDLMRACCKNHYFLVHRYRLSILGMSKAILLSGNPRREVEDWLMTRMTVSEATTNHCQPTKENPFSTN